MEFSLIGITRIIVGCIAAALVAFVAWYALSFILSILAFLNAILLTLACAAGAYVATGKLFDGSQSIGSVTAAATGLFARAKARFTPSAA